MATADTLARAVWQLADTLWPRTPRAARTSAHPPPVSPYHPESVHTQLSNRCAPDQQLSISFSAVAVTSIQPPSCQSR